MNSDWNEGFEAGISWHKESLKEIKVNQHDPRHYYFYRNDPYKQKYWSLDTEIKPSKGEFIIGSLLLILAFVMIGSVLFLN